MAKSQHKLGVWPRPGFLSSLFSKVHQALASVAHLQTKRLLVQFPVRVHSWVVGQILHWVPVSGNLSMFLSLSFSLPLSLKVIK